MGLTSIVCSIVVPLDAWESMPLLFVTGLLFWHTRKKWWAMAPGLAIGSMFGFVTVTSNKPDVVLIATLEFGAGGAMINAMCTGFFFPGFVAMITAGALGCLISQR